MRINKFFFITFFIISFNSLFSCEKKDINVHEIFSTNLILLNTKELPDFREDGASFETLVTEKNTLLYRITIFSSLGRTIYTCYFSNQNDLFIKKESFFYEQPYNTNNEECQIHYFKYDGICYLMDDTRLIKTDISDIEAVVDVRSINKLLDILSSNK